MADSILRNDWKHIKEKAFRNIVSYNGEVLNSDSTEEIKIHTVTRMDSILWEDSPISSLLKLCLQYNLIKLSDNASWTWPEELEIKVFNETIKSLEEKSGISLEEHLWGIEKFKWTIIDKYYTLNKWQSLKNTDDDHKISLRIRNKKGYFYENWIMIPKTIYYCTIKSKNKVDTILNHRPKKWKKVKLWFRECREEEFELPNPILFLELLKSIWLVDLKSKFKERTQIEINENIYLDADKYPNMPWFIEFEWSSVSTIIFYMELLWVIHNKTSWWWSWTLHDMFPEAKILNFH